MFLTELWYKMVLRMFNSYCWKWAFVAKLTPPQHGLGAPGDMSTGHAYSSNGGNEQRDDTEAENSTSDQGKTFHLLCNCRNGLRETLTSAFWCPL